MKIAYIAFGAVVLLPILVWIGLLLWAAIKDGDDQKARDLEL